MIVNQVTNLPLLRYTFLLYATIFGLICSISTNVVYAESPAFPLQTFADEESVFITSYGSPISKREVSACKVNSNGEPPIDISRVSISSNGKSLNAVLWLKGVGETDPSAFIEGLTKSLEHPRPTYTINIYDLPQITNRSKIISELIYKINNPQHFSPQRAIGPLQDVIDVRESIATSINEVPAQKVVYFKRVNDSNHYLESMITLFVFIKNSSVIVGNFTVDSSEYIEYIPVMEKIINSTEFVQISNSSLNTYYNPKMGIKFLYPSDWYLSAFGTGIDIFLPLPYNDRPELNIETEKLMPNMTSFAELENHT